MPTLFLARHASPDWSRTDIPYFVPPGPPLSPQGLEEAQALAAFLAAAGVQRLLTSPLERCLHTAQIAAAAAGAPWEVVDGLREWQPQESREIVLARALPVVEAAWQAAHADGSQPVALITHGGPILALLAALGIPDAALEPLRIYDHRNPLPPAGVWQATRPSPQAGWDLRLAFTPATARTFA